MITTRCKSQWFLCLLDYWLSSCFSKTINSLFTWHFKGCFGVFWFLLFLGDRGSKDIFVVCDLVNEMGRTQNRSMLFASWIWSTVLLFLVTWIVNEKRSQLLLELSLDIPHLLDFTAVALVFSFSLVFLGVKVMLTTTPTSLCSKPCLPLLCYWCFSPTTMQRCSHA